APRRRFPRVCVVFRRSCLGAFRAGSEGMRAGSRLAGARCRLRLTKRQPSKGRYMMETQFDRAATLARTQVTKLRLALGLHGPRPRGFCLVLIPLPRVRR